MRVISQDFINVQIFSKIFLGEHQMELSSGGIRELLQLCYVASLGSLDKSTQCGSVLFGSDGEPIMKTLEYNRFPKGVKDHGHRWDANSKKFFVSHAERNSLFAAARLGLATNGLGLAAPWACCADCAHAIVQCGIRTLVTHHEAYTRSPYRWKKSMDSAYSILDEAGVDVIFYNGKVFDGTDGPSVLLNADRWIP